MMLHCRRVFFSTVQQKMQQNQVTKESQKTSVLNSNVHFFLFLFQILQTCNTSQLIEWIGLYGLVWRWGLICIYQNMYIWMYSFNENK